MRILVVTPFLAYPGSSGGGTAVFNLIRNLALRHEIVYLSFARHDDLPHIPLIKPYCIDVVSVPFPGGEGMPALDKALYLARRVAHNILSLATLTPVMVWKCRSSAMRRELQQAIERFKPDIVHLCFPQMADYVRFCGKVPAVMDTQDVALVSSRRRAVNAASIFAKAYYSLQWLFWRRYESYYYRMFGKLLTLTCQDAAALKEINPDLDVYADAIGVDIGEPPVLEQRDSACRIGFLASFGHQPNVDATLYFSQVIFPLIRKQMCDAEFVVAGKGPPKALCERALEGIRCVGFVDDVPAFYGTVDVVVAPIRYGGGIKIKVLEAMACGKPVVTTSVGAEGIAVAGDGALIIADDPSAFAEAVVALLSDKARRVALGEQARQVIERRFSWQRVCSDLDKIYKSLAVVKK